jgi:DNA-binding CsgD family transcriptional regulator
VTKTNSDSLFAGFDPALLGYGLYWAWVFLSFDHTSSSLDIEGISVVLLVHLFSLIASAAVYLLIGVFFKLSRAILNNKPLSVALILCISVGTILYGFPPFSENASSLIAGSVLTGITSPWLLLSWGERYSLYEPREVIVHTSLSFIMAQAIVLLAGNAPTPVAGIVATAMPVASLATLLYRSPDSERHLQTVTDRNRDFPKKALFGAIPSRLMLGFLVVTFIYGGATAFLSTLETPYPQKFLSLDFPVFIVALLILAAVRLIDRKTVNLGVGYRFTLLLFAVIFIPLALMGWSFGWISSFFASVGIGSIEILTWILLASVAGQAKTPRFIVFAVGFALMHVGMAAGQIVGLLLIDQLYIFSILSICALVALAGFAFTDRDTTISFEPPDESERALIAQSAESLPLALDGFAERYRLTARESEVLQLWATGYSVKAIQAKLFISHSTARTHIQHIYEKCGTQNRDGIIALLENLQQG